MGDRAVILLVEDSEDDLFLIRKAFERAQVPNPLYCVNSGREALDYLAGEGKFANRAEYPLPDLMLLDLKMPEIDGFDVLRWVKRQASLASLRVVVLTSSDAIRDVNQAYQLGANSFLVKPMDFDRFTETVRMLQRHWLRLSKAPEVSREKKNDVTDPNPRSEREDADYGAYFGAEL